MFVLDRPSIGEPVSAAKRGGGPPVPLVMQSRRIHAGGASGGHIGGHQGDRARLQPQNTRWPRRVRASATAFSAASASRREVKGPTPFIKLYRKRTPN